METDTVFTPDGYPSDNFVVRDNPDIEREVEFALETGAPIHFVGPLDSGKTSLVKYCSGEKPLLIVEGEKVTEEDDVARQFFADIIDEKGDVPPALTPRNELIEEIKDEPRDQMRVVRDVFRAGEVAVLYDDFYAIPDDLQVQVANLVKAQFERGVTIFVTSIPSHRGDLTLANGDLSGRVRSVDVPKWSRDDLERIGRSGFNALEADISETTIESLAVRANGSPTEMHHLCRTAV